MSRFSDTERSPSTQVLRALREKHGLSQARAGRLVRKSDKYWYRCERGTPMHEGLFELFCIKLGEDFDVLIEAKEIPEEAK